MNHLGPRVSALADGQLSVAEADEALVHVAGCALCAERLRAERESRRTLAQSRAEPHSADLTARLLALPTEATAARAPSWPRRVVLASTGALAVSVVAVGALVVVGSVHGPRADPYAMLDSVSGTTGASPAGLEEAGAGEPSSEDVLAWMRAHGWSTPESLPTGMRVVGVQVHDGADGEVLELELAGAMAHVRILEQRGQLTDEEVAALPVREVGAHDVHVLPTGARHVAMQGAAAVVMVSAADDGAAGELVLRAIPAEDYDTSLGARLARGWDTLAEWVGP